MRARDVFAAATGRRNGQDSGAAPVGLRRVPGRGTAAAGLAFALVALLALAPAALAAPSSSKINPVTVHSITTATVSGEVTPDSEAVETHWFFQYAPQGTDHGESGEDNWSFGPSSFASIPKALGPTPVEDHLSELTAGKTYEVRIGTEASEGASAFVWQFSRNPEVRTFTTDPAPIAPAVSIDPAGAVTITTAHLTGSFNPEGGNEDAVAGPVPIAWHLQLNREGEGWNDVASGSIEGSEAVSNSDFPVEGEATSLVPGKEYKERLLLAYAGLEVADEDEFETVEVAPPAVSKVEASEIEYVRAKASGQVEVANGDPAFNASTCRFEFVTQAQFEAEGFAAAEPNGQLAGCSAEPTGPGTTAVEALLTHLQPKTVYHLRLVAANQGGQTAVEAAGTFETGEVAKPSLAPIAVTGITATAVHFEAELDTNSPEVAPAKDSIEEAFGTDWSFDMGGGGHAPADTTPEIVHGEAKGLKPNTEYTVTLHAANGGGAEEETATFTTEAIGPTLGTDVSTPGGPGEVTIRGYVNPNNRTVTDCHFEYGPTESYGQEAACEGDPNGPGPYEDSPGPPARVIAQLSGLTPGATYHYTLVAINGSGEAALPDQTVEVPAEEEEQTCPNAGMPGAGLLPDCRAYEMVSPPDKNGGSVIATSDRTQVASDGNAVSFTSLAAFGDAIGTGVSTEYMSLRGNDPNPGDNGWTTHSITPPRQPTSVNGVLQLDSLYVGDLSSDLSRGVVRAPDPLTEEPNTAKLPNLYRRTDLRTPGGGAYELLSACPLCDLSGTPLPPPADNQVIPVYAGASSDFRHIIFEQRVNLTADAPAQPAGCTATDTSSCMPRLYEWVDGQLSLAGLVPSGSDTSCGGTGPACVVAAASIAGHGVGSSGTVFRPIHDISSDGARVFFTVPTNGSGNVTNGRQRDGKLYVRTSGTTTDQISASERTDCVGDPTCGGDGIPDPAPDTFQSASYWGASADGSRAFFTTEAALTDDAPVGGNNKLYMYDATKPASDSHNLTLINAAEEPGDTSNSVAAVLSESEDGRSVFFISNGQLVAGQPLLRGDRGFFIWHDGRLTYLGRMRSNEEVENGTSRETYRVLLHGRMTPDGRHLLISIHDASGLSLANNQPGCRDSDAGCRRELYLYSADTNSLTCVSCGPEGVKPETDAEVGVRQNASSSTVNWHVSHAMADDGSRVFFSTGEALVPEDTNGKYDAYEYDTRTNAVHLLSSGTEETDSYFVEASPSGHDAFFVTRERLVGWDPDTSYDLYDARVGGGFPEPAPEVAPCVGDACKEGPSNPPEEPPTGSSSFSGPVDPTIRRCPKGRHRVKSRNGKARCVKRRHKSQKQHRRAKADGRTGR